MYVIKRRKTQQTKKGIILMTITLGTIITICITITAIYAIKVWAKTQSSK